MITEVSKKTKIFFNAYDFNRSIFLYYFTELEPSPTVRSILDGADWKSFYSPRYEEAFAVCRVCSSVYPAAELMSCDEMVLFYLQMPICR